MQQLQTAEVCGLRTRPLADAHPQQLLDPRTDSERIFFWGCCGRGLTRIIISQHEFLPRDASAERGDATVSRLSVRLSVCNDQVPWSYRLEFFENNFAAE